MLVIRKELGLKLSSLGVPMLNRDPLLELLNMLWPGLDLGIRMLLVAIGFYQTLPVTKVDLPSYFLWMGLIGTGKLEVLYLG